MQTLPGLGEANWRWGDTHIARRTLVRCHGARLPRDPSSADIGPSLDPCRHVDPVTAIN